MKAKQMLAGLGLGLALVCAQSEFKTLSWTVEGKSDISGNNVAAAQSAALADAFSQALRGALSETLAEKVLKDKAKIIADVFYKDPNRFVSRYHIVSEGPQEKSYVVQVEVELSADSLQVGLVQAGLIPSSSRVVILAVVSEDNGQRASGWITPASSPSLPEKILTLELQSWGYRVAPPSPAFDPVKWDQNPSDPAWLAKLRDKYSADILVLGKLELKTELKAKAGAAGSRNIEDTAEAGADLYSCLAGLKLNLVDLGGVEKTVALDSEQNMTAAGADQAKSITGEAAVRSILPELSIALDRMTQAGLSRSGSSEELLEVTGLAGFYQYRQVYDQLKKLEAIRDLQLHGFAPGTAQFSIRFAGDREALKKAITQAKSPEFRLLPIESDRSGLKFKFESL